MKRLALFAVVLVLVLAAGAAFVLLAPYGPEGETFADIPAKTGTAGIATRLQQAGVIRSRWAFEAVKAVHGGTLKAGEYRFQGPLTVAEVYAKVRRGDVYAKILTVPEGANVYDIAHAVELAGLGSADDFLAASRKDTALIKDLSPHAETVEGFLFPDTYKVRRNATPDQIVAIMLAQFRKAAAQLGLAGGPQMVETVTMASIIEKEAGAPEERPVIAGVFRNRLAVGMRLETDPTVIYAAELAGRWHGVIHQSDLHIDSPYNTYQKFGLPPGPIANPGAAALKAAMTPTQTAYLYFVADGHGRTQFSSTLAEHELQVKAYRQATQGR